MSTKSAAQRAREYAKAYYRIAQAYGIDMAQLRAAPHIAPGVPGQQARDLGPLYAGWRRYDAMEREKVAGYAKAGFSARQSTAYATAALAGTPQRAAERARLTGYYAEGKIASLPPKLRGLVTPTMREGRVQLRLEGAGKSWAHRLDAKPSTLLAAVADRQRDLAAGARARAAEAQRPATQQRYAAQAAQHAAVARSYRRSASAQRRAGR